MFSYFISEKIVGFLEFHILENSTLKIDNIVILPEYRNMGIGTKFLRYLKEFCKNNGYTKLTLGMIDDNTMLKKWYIKNGFSESHKVKFPKAPFTTVYMEMTV